MEAGPEHEDQSEDLELHAETNAETHDKTAEAKAQQMATPVAAIRTDETFARGETSSSTLAAPSEEVKSQEEDDDSIATAPPQPASAQTPTLPPAESSPQMKPAPMPVIDESTIFNGDILRQVREHRGISLKTISGITRIGVPNLMAVEEERYEDLPNARIYILGFVRCLAKEIGLDSELCSKSYVLSWQRWWDERTEDERRSYR